MATCIQICQDLQSICCDGSEVRGNATITLTGNSCQLYDANTNAWVPVGRVGTFQIGDPTFNQWISCGLPCLDTLVDNGGTPASELGFYYTVSVTVAGNAACTYTVAPDCSVMGLNDGDIVKLEDIITDTPTTPNTGSAICNAVKSCETTTTLVDNGDGTATYTNEAGSSTTIAISGAGVAPSQISVAGSTITHTAGDGTVTDIDVCAIIADNCDNALDFDSNTGVLSLTLHDGTPSTVNIGSSETVTTMTDNGDCTWTYVSETGVNTTIDASCAAGSMVDNGDGTFTYTPGAGGTPITISTASTGAVSTLTDNGDGTFTHDPGDGSQPVTLDVCQMVVDGNCQSGGSETITTLVDNPGAGTFVYTNEAGAPVTVNYGGAETVTTLVDNGNGTLTYTNENNVTTTFRNSDEEKAVFAYPELVTEVSCSGRDIYHRDIEIYCYAVTVDTAPTGPETFNLIDLGPTGTGNTDILGGTQTLAAGSFTTGLVNITPYTLPAGNLMQSNILTVNGSEKWHLHVFYRELVSELTS